MENTLPAISVISPVYKSAASINELCSRLTDTLEKLTANYEIILVNDGSPHNDWAAIQENAHKDKRIKGVNLSRNFGQHNAIFTGLNLARGEWVVVMDCDLQDRPEEILKLYAKAQEGFDIVFAKRIDRHDNFFRKIFSKLFYKILSYLTETALDETIANFGIYRKKAIAAVLRINDHTKYFPTMIKWVGFRSVAIEVEHAQRTHGKTAYSYKRLVNLAFDVMLSFSNKPLLLVVKAGLAISTLSILLIIYYIVLYFKGEIIIQGWASLILSVWFLSGIIIFVLGIVGLYIGKVFEKIKDRPSHIIADSINLETK